MDQKKRPQRHRMRIASNVPGRLRIKLHPESRGLEAMQAIKGSLESQAGIHDVRLNQTNGSVTVKYDHGRYSTTGILSLLEDLDVLMEPIGHMAASEELGATSSESTEPVRFLAAIEDLNARIYAATGVPIDLKIVLPLTFIGAAIWSIGKRGLMIESVPGWLFLWFAFDMFVKLHPRRP